MSDETTPNTPETEASTSETKPDQADKAQPTEAQSDASAKKPARAPKTAEAGDGEKPAKPPKKEKPPALEDKPFPEFIEQHFLPALKQTLAKVGISDLDLKFEKRKLPIAALGDTEYWQVIGQWQGGQRQFNILFSKEDIQAPKFFTCADYGAEPTLLESFMIDERKVNLDLMLLYTVQRLNGQKWLVMN
jgi:hypothetical protein